MPKILKQNATDIADAFTLYDLWMGGGSSTLSDLTDVELTDLQINEVLQYDGNKWINAIVQGGGNVGAQVELITQITVLPIPIDFTKYDLYVYVIRSQDNGNVMGGIIVTKADYPISKLILPCNDDVRIIISNGNQITENTQNYKAYLYGIKFAPIEPNLHEYSTDEKVVGKWIDGKLIYELTIEVNVIVASSQYWFTICEVLNIERVFSIICYDNNNKIITFEEAQTTGNNVQIWCNTPSAGRNIKQVIIQFTKTTD